MNATPTPPAGQSPAGGAGPTAELRAAIDAARAAVFTFRAHPGFDSLPPELLDEFADDLIKLERSVGFARAQVARAREDAGRRGVL
ncbi:hypothetical protein [Frankia sp. AgB32]|uniref:hypothetical protein n=1 Tax=Frankia sp. AgB32 TaxID=631119 RepID=UPI00200FA7C3|nr:hypothetical protein [Frankia sp. AgB32]MCK9894724.1 hypothetical protein [Frankia sp. AgB32]